ncbi:MAG: hypothetical protein SOZ90_04330 [Candidatus Faecousia sp.]|nr:hypothetical protein [Candidatus Faecousia sp.]
MSERMSQAVARIGAAVGKLDDATAERIAEKMEFAATLFTAAAQTGSEKERKEDKAS